jgi:hypothetical protein
MTNSHAGFANTPHRLLGQWPGPRPHGSGLRPRDPQGPHGGGWKPAAVADRKTDGCVERSYGGRTGGANTGFRFDLKGVTRTTAPGWFHLTGYGQDLALKSELKVGGTETLNIYTAKLGANLLGYAYLAQDADEVGVLDGVAVDYQSLPGGSYSLYSEGDTATHEVGHWLDLLHTFDGGCEGGDHVADTAPEASPAYNCPRGAGHVQGRRPRPDHQLHGLLPGQLHVRVHARSGGADAAGVDRLSRIDTSTGEPSGAQVRRFPRRYRIAGNGTCCRDDPEG